MKKETMEYLRGERNAVKDEFILGREMAGSSELIFVSLPDREKPIYALWNSRKSVNNYKKKEDEDGGVTFERVSPSGTGGETAYVMLMDYAILELNKRKISLDASGIIFKLVSYVEWNTGRLCRKRDGMALTRRMMFEILDVSRQRFNSAIKELKNLNVLYYDYKKQAYFINSKYIRKGAACNED